MRIGGEVARDGPAPGPDVGWNPAPISFATIWAERGLAQARRTAEQQVVDGLAAAPRAVDQQRQLLLHPLLPDELVERRRPQRDVELAILRVDDGGLDQAVVVHVSDPPSAALRAADPRPSRSSTSHGRQGLARLLRREPERQQRLAHVGERALDDQVALAAQLVAQVEHHALGHLLAHARDDREGVGVAGHHRCAAAHRA